MPDFNVPTAVPGILSGVQMGLDAYTGMRQREELNRRRQEGAQLIQGRDPTAIAQWTATNPDLAQELIQAANIQDTLTQKSRVQNAKDILTGRISPREAYRMRAEEIESKGGDASLIRDDLESMNDDELLEEAKIDLAVMAPKAFEAYQKAKGINQGKTGKERSRSENIKILKGAIDKDGKLKPRKELTTEQQIAAIDEGLLPRAIGSASQTITQRGNVEDVADTEKKLAEASQRGKGSAKTERATIDAGIDAAKGIPVLKRTLSILDIVETGGFDAALIRTKQLFGIEGADEGELSANLGQAVLGDLRATFGAQFTEKEGARLERIRANLGRSPAANRRLISQALQIAQDAADRAIDRAIDAGDMGAVEEIERLLKFEIQDEIPSPDQPPVVTTQEQFNALPSGAIFVEDGQTYRKP